MVFFSAWLRSLSSPTGWFCLLGKATVALGFCMLLGFGPSVWAVTNLGPQATVTASSYDTGAPDLYRPDFVNDGKANPDNWYHWCNNFWTDSASATNPVRLTLTWPSARSIRKVVVHTKRNYEVQDFRIDYLDGSTWKLFSTANVTGNLETRVEILAVSAVSTTALRLSATRGPEIQPELVRISELEAYQDDPVFDIPPPQVLIRKFQPEKPLCRAGRPVVLSAELFNSFSNSLSAIPQLNAPAGVLLRQSANGIPVVLEEGAKKTVKWVAEFNASGTYALPLTVNAGSGGAASNTLTLRVLPAVTISNSATVPAPQPVQTTALVGALNWPYWVQGLTDFWRPVMENPERTPALGFYGQDTGQVNDWELKWAAEHGIGFFVYNWARDGRGLDTSRWSFPFGNNHIAQRLTNSVFTAHVQCAVQFNNGTGTYGVGGTNDLLNNLAPYWINTFFNRPDYLKVDNKPLLFIYDMPQLISDLGGTTNAAAALSAVRARCVQAGFAGLYVIGESRFYDVPAPGGPEYQHVQQLTAAGVDATFAYHWHLGDNPDPATAIERQMTYYQKAREFNLIPPIMTASMGWTGWRNEGSMWRIPPDGYQSLLEQIKNVNATLPTNSLGSRMVLLDNWNEFGEGHYLAPHREFGFGYLDAVRNVFAPNAPSNQVDLIPEDLGLGPYDSGYASSIQRDIGLQPTASQKVTRNLSTESGLVAWWTFDEETSFPVAYDSSGNRLGGILRNATGPNQPTRTNRPSGKALDCRNGGCVGVAPDDKLSPSSGLTVSCWVRTDQSGQDGTYILNRLYLGNDSGYQLGMASGKPFFRVPQTDNSHQLIATNILPTGRWVHLAGTCDGKEIRFYVDGQPAGTLARHGKINSNNATLWIGSYVEGPSSASSAFQGLIDEMKIYNRARSAVEISAEATAGLTGTPTAAGQSLAMVENTAKKITLAGSHPETASILSMPLNGSLTGTGAQRTYTPNPNFQGADQFTFRVSSGGTNSAPATVSITVSAGGSNGLVGWWKMDEVGGTVVADASGRGNHGILQNGTWSSGKSGGALQFHGTNSILTIPDSEDLDGMSALTLAGWIRLNQLPTQSVVPVGKEAEDASYRVVIGANGAAQFVVSTANNAWYTHGTWVDLPAGTFTAGTWHHFVGTYDRSSLKCYLDGQLVGSASPVLSGEISDGVASLALGNLPWNRSDFHGMLDDVRLYHRVLSLGEIRQIVADTGGTSLFGFWAGSGVSLTPDLLRNYAVGGASSPAKTRPNPVMSLESGNLRLNAIVRMDDPRLTIVAQYATNLPGPWTNVPSHPAGIQSSDQSGVGAGCERRDFLMPVGPDPRGFMRLNVVYLP